MSKRTLNNSTNENKRFKGDESGRFKNRKNQSATIESSMEENSIFDDDEVFHDEQSVTSKSINQSKWISLFKIIIRSRRSSRSKTFEWNLQLSNKANENEPNGKRECSN